MNDRHRDPKESPQLAQDRQAHGRRIIESIFGPPAPEEWDAVSLLNRVLKAAQRVAYVEIGARHNPDGYGMSTLYDRDHGAAMDELIAAVQRHDHPPRDKV